MICVCCSASQGCLHVLQLTCRLHAATSSGSIQIRSVTLWLQGAILGHPKNVKRKQCSIAWQSNFHDCAGQQGPMHEDAMAALKQQSELSLANLHELAAVLLG